MNIGCLSIYCVFFNFFHQCLGVSSAQIFHHLDMFFPKYCTLFNAIVNGIFFLISFFSHFNAYIDLYPATVLNLFISCTTFSMKSLGILHVRSFYLYTQIMYPFLSHLDFFNIFLDNFSGQHFHSDVKQEWKVWASMPYS